MTHYTIAAVQHPPVFLDRDATTSRACALIAEAGKNGASLVVFPEAFIPGYPDWINLLAPKEYAAWAELYARFLEQSVGISGPAVTRIGEAARQAGVHVAIGVVEMNSEASGGTIYNSLLYFAPDGELIGRHRKLVPTGPERLVWGRGGGDSLRVYSTPLGKLGGLICWENYMPLARYTLYAQGIQVYLAPTWDRGEIWLATIRHIAKEAGAFVVGCGMPLQLSDIPDDLEFKARYDMAPDAWINVGDSAIAGPDGSFVAGPLHAQTGILYGSVDLRQVSTSKWMLDVAGHYARPDVFQLSVRPGGGLLTVVSDTSTHGSPESHGPDQT